ncbi:CPBP family intramembrane metalloprotease [Xanthomonas hortorum pv. hederae]|uniref:CPBP family intramembrane metalloprotease n=2 Tax=Xanthomonas hortorum TaxID=56454 RepID=A0A9X4H805_9XANT|nr:CPBP family intramembrane glutamic endopeptidase [Xanthomonas hortorum]MCE4372235.1 CPBP family intramembrane metalloprotease [Xanthomonas hortorum pv. hederae]MDC8639223.1 CPBP family intramembrane metalloprotease [Xanthomonas hortorum pv. hederae]
MNATTHLNAGLASPLPERKGQRIELGERGFLKPGRLRWLRAIAWAVVLFFLVAIPTGVVTRFLGGFWEKTNGPVQLAVNLVGCLVALGVYTVAVRLAEQRTPSEIALRPMLPQLSLGLLAGAAMFASAMGIMAMFGLYDIQATGPAPVWTALRKALQAGVVEELMVRAVLLRLVWRAAGPWIAFAVSCAVFGFSHLGNPNATVIAAICIALEAGVMLGAFYALTGRIWVSIGAHIAWNFTQGYVFGASVSGMALGPAIARSIPNPNMPEWLTGGAFGPEASLPGAVICLTVGLTVAWLAWRSGKFAKQ